MSRESELLELARSAFQATLPSEDQTRKSARRLERRLRERTRRPRRFAPLLSAAFALAGALAYAAEASRSFEAASERTAPLPVPERPAPRASVAPAATTPKLSAAPAAPVAASSHPPAAVQAAPASPAKPSPRAHASAPERASWATVARSLARGDERAARLELERLRVNGNSRDRANAAVELARLAAHRGDCARAADHLGQARASLGSSPSLARAAEAVKRCELGSAPARAQLKD